MILNARFPAAEIASCDQSRYRFSDVQSSHWARPFLCLAKQKSILHGYPDGKFQSDNSINLAETLKVTLKVYEIDVSQYPKTTWYSAYLQAAIEKGYLQKINTQPEHNLTRGEMAQLIYNIEKLTF